ncbi:metallophosphoesterase [Armatimonas sp.]|uniref:metallophosphoesterase n=1 Tax=Armatimonas sp. TaxID=1872638 RepID=UPI00375261E8
MRRWLLSGGILGSGTAALAVYGRHEAHQPVVENVTVTLPTLPLAFDGLRAVVLGDLHVCPSFPAANLAPALALAKAAQPELVLLVGDYVCDREGDYGADMAACISALEPLARSARLGAFASFGNHDFPTPPLDPPHTPWASAGITPLFDSAAQLQSEKALLWLVGLRSAISRPTNPQAVLGALPTKDAAPRVLLWHEPDRAALAAKAGASLMLSGHTHGGQLVVPGVGPLRLPQEGRRYPAGLVYVEGMPLYTTRGVGVLPPRMRLNCPPEVTVLTLKRG